MKVDHSPKRAEAGITRDTVWIYSVVLLMFSLDIDSLMSVRSCDLDSSGYTT